MLMRREGQLEELLTSRCDFILSPRTLKDVDESGNADGLLSPKAERWKQFFAQRLVEMLP